MRNGDRDECYYWGRESVSIQRPAVLIRCLAGT